LNGVPRLRLHQRHHAFNQRTRSKVLARTFL
jgi:hypothetical protein